MSDDRLIVVMTSGRSGSSMVCGLLAKHGVWCGKTKNGDYRNPSGFFENMQVYKACDNYGQFKKESGIAIHDGKWPDKFMKLVKKQGYKSGAMVVKHIPNCYPIWDDLNPIYVTVRRDMSAQMASRDNIKKRLCYDAIAGRERCMDYLESKGAIRVDSQDIINGDYSKIDDILQSVGIEIDPRICKAFVNPEYWHF